MLQKLDRTLLILQYEVRRNDKYRGLGRARMKLTTTSVKWTGFSMFTERIKKVGIIRASCTQETIFKERQILTMKKNINYPP